MIQNIKEFCKLFYRTTFIPIAHYITTTEIDCSFPYSPQTIDLTTGILPHITPILKNPDYFISQSHAYYGAISLNQGAGFIIIGPTFSTPPTSATIRILMKELTLSSDKQADIQNLFTHTTIISFHHFLNTMAYLHLCLNGETIEFTTHFKLLDPSAYRLISSLHSNQIYQAKEEENFHNTYQFEQQYLKYIKEGNPEKLKSLFLEYNFALKEGNLADNALRQAKNIFISGTTLTTRAAISGGLGIEQAYHLSDTYIKECENIQSVDSLTNLNFTMNLDFAKRVAESKIPEGVSKDIFECIQYVLCHTNTHLQVEDVARHIGRSRSYVSRKFKSELGFNLNAFIMRCKLEEAKSLLTYSEKSLSEISSYLCFSSQSYFQNVFKKKYGLTPMEYRNQTINL